MKNKCYYPTAKQNRSRDTYFSVPLTRHIRLWESEEMALNCLASYNAMITERFFFSPLNDKKEKVNAWDKSLKDGQNKNTQTSNIYL